MVIPFAIEDGGRIGAHGQAALRMFSHMSAREAPLLPLEAVAMWTRRWQQKLYAWLHLTLSRLSSAT